MEKVSKTIKECVAEMDNVPIPDGSKTVNDLAKFATALEELRKATDGLEEFLKE